MPHRYLFARDGERALISGSSQGIGFALVAGEPGARINFAQPFVEVVWQTERYVRETMI